MWPFVLAFLYKMKFLLAKNIMCVFKLLAKEETCPHWLHLWASLCCVFASCEMSPWPAGLNSTGAVLNNLSESLKLVSRTNHHRHRSDFVETGNHLFFWWKTWMTLTLRKWHWHRAATLETDQGETGRGDWGRHARRRPSSHPKGNIENNIQTRLN